MTPKERELFQGMVNCYQACHASFEDTVSMVGSARGLTPQMVKETLSKIREADGHGEEYRALRSRLPDGFPF